MSYRPLTAVLPRVILVAGILLAVSMLAIPLYNSAFAQEDGPIPYAENDTEPVATYTALDPEGTAIIWSLLGTDAGKFDIDINGGVLTFKQSPNYEAPADVGTDNEYEVTVVATDSDNSAAEKAVTVMVTNEDEAGTLTLSTLQPVDGIDVTATLTDIDSVANGNDMGTVTTGDITWKWAKSLNHAGTYTDIDGATMAAYTPKPADVDHYLRATATYTDGQGPDKTEMVISANKVLTPRSTNTPPVFNDADGAEIPTDTNITREVAENTRKGEAVGDPVVAVDSEGDVLTYTLGGTDAASFDINVATGQLKTKAALDRERDEGSTYTVTVTATDPSFTTGADSDTITVDITVTNVDEDPELTGMDMVRFDENTAVTTDVATYTATDDEDGVSNTAVDLMLSGADAGDFNITDGVLTFKESPNYEDPADAGTNNVYNITVVATDSDDQTDTIAVTVTVTNVNEDGTVMLSALQPRVGTPLTATLTDVDGDVSDVVWMWEKGTGPSLGSSETIEGADSDSYTPTADDAGDYLRATATSYTDPQGSGQPEVTAVSGNAVEMDDTNKAPEFPDQDMETEGEQTDQERMVPENTAADTAVGTPVMATDPNTDNLTYTLGGTDMASFSIVRDSGQLQTKAELNKEGKDTYMVTVTATDPSGLSATVNVTIKVTDVEEAPEVTGMDSVRVPENTAVSTAVATYMATDDEDDKAGTAIIWSLTGIDAGVFNITAGVLIFKQSPNYEAPADVGTDNEYEVTVVATDSDNSAAEKAVTVMVTNEDEAGTLTLSTLQPVDGIDVTATLTDIDSVANGNDMGTVTADDIAWKWAKSRNKTGTYTDIDGATMAAYTPKPADVNHYLRATATYTDGQGSDKTEIVISARKVLRGRSENTAPVFKNADGAEIPTDTNITREVAENTRKGEAVGDPVVAVDSEGDVLTYTLGGDDAASFDIDVATGQLKTKAALDRERDEGSTYTVTVTATDPSFTTGADSDTITVDITVTNVDEDPELTGMDMVRFDENTAVTTDVATYTATDDEDGVSNTAVDLMLSGADAGDFNITDGVLTFKESPNYEDPADAGTNNVYNITVVATDSDDQTDTMAVTVMVTNVDEEGTLTLSTLQPRVGTPLTATLTDVDGDVSDVVWMWEKGTEPSLGSSETIEGADSDSYTPTADDAGDYLRATATSYTDPQGSGQPEVTAVSGNAVEMDDTNKAPEFPDQDMETEGEQTDQERMVPENTAADTAVGTPVMATDPNEGDVLTYTLGGTDMASFSIVRDSGQLQTKAELNKEDKDTYMVTVTATDPSGLSATVNVTIKVTNVEEAPEIMRGGLAITGQRSVRYDENGTDPVGTYTASGPDAASATWMLSGFDAGDFSLSNDGMLTFNAPPDFEAPADADRDNVYEVTLEAEVGNSLRTHYVTVTVTNVAELGMVSGDATADYAENDTDAAATYTADVPVTAAWSVSGADMDDFDINGGMLMFVTPPDFEMPTDMGMDNVYQVTVQANAGGEMDMVDVTITVTNVEEAGTVTLISDQPVVGTAITSALADPDGGVTGTTWQWASSGSNADDATWTNIVEATMASYTPTADDDGMYLQATASYTDEEGAGKTAMAVSANTVSMASTNTAPAFSAETAERMVVENNAAGEPVGGPVTAMDADDDTLTYTLGGADMASFTIDDMGQIKVGATTMLDYEATQNTYMVTVTASDGTASDSIEVTVTVTNVDEDGMVTLWAGTGALTMAPQVGDTITGAVMDPDGGVTGETWQWARTMDTANMSSWMDIADETNAVYMVAAGDTGYYLRVMATYTDAVGTDMAMEYSMPTMMVVPVGGGDHPLVTRFDYNGNGQIDKSDVVDAINEYLDDVEGISKTDVIDLINYYLDS